MCRECIYVYITQTNTQRYAFPVLHTNGAHVVRVVVVQHVRGAVVADAQGKKVLNDLHRGNSIKSFGAAAASNGYGFFDRITKTDSCPRAAQLQRI